MRRSVGTLLAVAVGAVVLVAPANAATTTSAPANVGTRTFISCNSMHRTFQYGVAVSSIAANRAVRAGYHRPSLQPVVYGQSPKTLDRGNSGVMCAVKR